VALHDGVQRAELEDGADEHEQLAQRQPAVAPHGDRVRHLARVGRAGQDQQRVAVGGVDELCGQPRQWSQHEPDGRDAELGGRHRQPRVVVVVRRAQAHCERLFLRLAQEADEVGCGEDQEGLARRAHGGLGGGRGRLAEASGARRVREQAQEGGVEGLRAGAARRDHQAGPAFGQHHLAEACASAGDRGDAGVLLLLGPAQDAEELAPQARLG
jgi:hypothetical protein